MSPAEPVISAMLMLALSMSHAQPVAFVPEHARLAVRCLVQFFFDSVRMGEIRSPHYS